MSIRVRISVEVSGEVWDYDSGERWADYRHAPADAVDLLEASAVLMAASVRRAAK